MASTRVGRHLKAPRERVYAALIHAEASAAWKVPTGMTSEVHEFEGRELVAVHDGLPPGLAPADNEAGWREALDKLAALVETGCKSSTPGTGAGGPRTFQLKRR